MARNQRDSGSLLDSNHGAADQAALVGAGAAFASSAARRARNSCAQAPPQAGQNPSQRAASSAARTAPVAYRSSFSTASTAPVETALGSSSWAILGGCGHVRPHRLTRCGLCYFQHGVLLLWCPVPGGELRRRQGSAASAVMSGRQRRRSQFLGGQVRRGEAHRVSSTLVNRSTAAISSLRSRSAPRMAAHAGRVQVGTMPSTAMARNSDRGQVEHAGKHRLHAHRHEGLGPGGVEVVERVPVRVPFTGGASRSHSGVEEGVVRAGLGDLEQCPVLFRRSPFDLPDGTSTSHFGTYPRARQARGRWILRGAPASSD